MKGLLRKWLLIALTGVSALAVLGYLLVGIGFPGRLPAGGMMLLGCLAAAGLLEMLLVGVHLLRMLWKDREQIQYHDNFTGVGNSQLLAKDYAALKTPEGNAFVLIRLNGFNRLNMLFGLNIGGKTVKRLMPLLEDFAGSRRASIYRPTLDSFVLLCPVTDRGVFEKEVLKLLSKMEQVYVQDGHVTYSYHYTFAYNIYYLSEADRGAKQLERFAIMAYASTDGMAESKESTGLIYDEKNKPNWELYALLEEHVQEGWRNREFVPYYQLLYDLERNQPVGAELLTRWNFPGKGLIMPNDFLPVLEDAGLIMELDLYMLEEACKRIKGWMEAELVTVPLAINISKLNLHRQDFVDRVIKIIEAYDIPPVLIELELPESAVLFEKNEAFFALMKRLHDFGVSLSMDNFAANDYSSANLLREVQVDVIKLSRQFFRNVKENTRDRVFIKSIITMAKAMGIRIVAMGVEREEDAALFQQLGCRYGQGYYLSKPMSDQAFEEQIF